MAGTILTPGAIWRDFEIKNVPSAQEISQKKSGGINYTELYIDGRAIADGAIKIYAKLARAKSTEKAPAILLLGDFTRSCDKIQDDLAKKGYIVLAVDIEGARIEKEHFTIYPNSISHANYREVKDSLYKIKDDVKSTCWYEWTAVMRYALAYLKNVDGVTKVGGLGFGESCAVMWQVAGTDENLDCACFALNAGWNGYRGTYKFGGAKEASFSDDMYKFIAGVDPQSYATHVNCPVLMLSATNSDVYDIDRAYDTISRISGECYRAVHYSVGFCNSVSPKGYENVLIFFENTLKKKGKITLPKEMEIKCEVVDGALSVQVVPDKKEIESLSLYVSEQTVRPSLRAWRRIDEYKSLSKKGEYEFEYAPYPESGMVTLFAKARYKSGFSICSPVISKKFKAEEMNAGYKSNIIYSSRLSGNVATFVVDCNGCETYDQIFTSDSCSVKVKKGPMGIEGATRKCGLTTFKINSLVDKPREDAILMFDAHSKVDIELNVKLITNYFDDKQTYISTVKLFGGNIWNNVKLPLNKFKTAEGMPLKKFNDIQAISFECEEGEFILNNALWV